MREFLFSILFLCFITSCNNHKQKQTGEKQELKKEISMVHRIPDSLFLYHFNILDSAAKMPAKDTMYHCCYNSVNFMEAHTSIVADVEGDYGGATGFKKEDLRKWHEWYDKEYGKKN